MIKIWSYSVKRILLI